MDSKHKKIAHAPKGLRYKLMLAFSLMSIIPLLACTYLIVSYIFAQLDVIPDASAVLFMAIAIALLGLALAKRLVDPVITMALEARNIANGDYDKKLLMGRDDEIGNIGESINVLTQKIRSNIDELKTYGQRTREINLEIHKKVLALSSLLQIGDVISAGSTELSTLLNLSLQKMVAIFDTGFGVLYMPQTEESDFLAKASCNVENEAILGLVVKRAGNGLLERSLRDHTLILIDSATKMSKEIETFMAAHGIQNLVAIPIYSGKRDLGILVVGNKLDDFKFKTDDIDMLKVFAKQVTIAIENDFLMKRTKELTVTDDLTGLYNKTFILARLEEEIKRAIFYQRPCSFIVINVDGFNPLRETHGELFGEEVLKKIAKLLGAYATPIGKTARVGGDEFAVLLPEKNKNEAIALAEEIRKRVEATTFFKESTRVPVTVSAGVSENPIDGATHDELYKKAIEALRHGKAQGKNKVSV